MPFNYTKAQATADRLIKKFGGKAILRRASGDREIKCAITDYTPEERTRNPMINQIDRIAIVSALGLSVAPDSQRDVLVILDPSTGDEVETLRIVAPPGKLAPAGIIVYWELQVRG